MGAEHQCLPVPSLHKGQPIISILHSRVASQLLSLLSLSEDTSGTVQISPLLSNHHAQYCCFPPQDAATSKFAMGGQALAIN